MGGGDDIKPTTINFNTVLDAWAKSGGGRSAAERAEEVMEWMDRLHKAGNEDVHPDTITFNAVLDSWARSGDRRAPHRAEQILNHMQDLHHSGYGGVKPDTYTCKYFHLDNRFQFAETIIVIHSPTKTFFIFHTHRQHAN